MADNESMTKIITNNVSVKKNWSAVTTVIVLLLGVILVSMAWNYALKYLNSVSSLSCEEFNESAREKQDQSNQISQSSQSNQTNQTANIQPPVQIIRSITNDPTIAKNKDTPFRTKSDIVSKEIDNSDKFDKSGDQAYIKEIIKETDKQDLNKKLQKTDRPESGVFKIIIYHMKGCGHCMMLMERQNTNEKSIFEKLSEIENVPNICKSNERIQVLDFQYGKDNEASKFQAFPVIMFVTPNGSEEYSGSRDAQSIFRSFVNKIKQN